MTNNQPLTLTVEQAARVLGVGPSTAYELVRSGDLKHIRLRRRVVVPVAHLAERLGVDRAAVWAVLVPTPETETAGPPHMTMPTRSAPRRAETRTVETPMLF